VPSRGLIAGAGPTGPTDFRAHAPRFQGENLQRNLDLVARLSPVAARYGITVAQLAIAWALAQGEDIVPVIGMRRRSRIAEALAAADVQLDSDALAEIDAAVPAGSAAGERYAPHAMASLDSEVATVR
jgi:aryl-alcohol dehydrogenase-like predicted oxidoreductase